MKSIDLLRKFGWSSLLSSQLQAQATTQEKKTTTSKPLFFLGIYLFLQFMGMCLTKNIELHLNLF